MSEERTEFVNRYVGFCLTHPHLPFTRLLDRISEDGETIDRQADELREARRLLRMAKAMMHNGTRMLEPEIDAFIARTSRFEKPSRGA